MIIEDKLMKFVVFQKRTEAEVRQKCKKLEYTSDYTDEIIDYLKENAYLDDKKYVEKYIQNVMRLKISSIYEMKVALLKKGVEETLIDNYINTNQEELTDFEYDSAKKAAMKKWKQTPEIEKIKKYMLGKGYSYDSMNEAIDNLKKLNDNSNEELYK